MMELEKLEQILEKMKNIAGNGKWDNSETAMVCILALNFACMYILVKSGFKTELIRVLEISLPTSITGLVGAMKGKKGA